ncbi:hypothetical protein B0A48_02310 [Cryoendolithus antarcticus]|uniref:Uncharacterized protein n=1 Tax=Cryoendolithus antarcticus TaxID=1507870 RepID=A0A1V8TNB1_9PEZI|nr:hypothetical protein B0A48_02310 [Cryoendolithus antarcticus]
MHFSCFSSAPSHTITEKDWMRPSRDSFVSARIKWWNSKAAGDALSLQQTLPTNYFRANKLKELLASFAHKSPDIGDDDAESKGCFGLFAGRKKAPESELAPQRNFTVRHSSIQAGEQRRARIDAAKARRQYSVAQTQAHLPALSEEDIERIPAKSLDHPLIRDSIHLGLIVQQRDPGIHRISGLEQDTLPGAEQLRIVVSDKSKLMCSSPAFSIVPSLYATSEGKEEGPTTAATAHAKASAGSEANATALPSHGADVSRRSIDGNSEEVETGLEAVSQRPLSWYRKKSKNSNNRKRSRPDKGHQHIHSSSSSGTSETPSASLVGSDSTRSSTPPSTVAVQASPEIEPACHKQISLLRASSSASPAYVSDDKGNIERVASIRAKVPMDTTDSKTGLTHSTSLLPGGSASPRTAVIRKPVPGSYPTSVAEWSPKFDQSMVNANKKGAPKLYTAYHPSFAKSIGEDPLYQTPGELAIESQEHRSDKDIDAEIPDFDAGPDAVAAKYVADLDKGVVGEKLPVSTQTARQLRSSRQLAQLKRSSAVHKSSPSSSPRTPKPHRMNSNRYPVHSPETARKFSAMPMYTRGGQDKGETWDQKRKEDKALVDKERKKAAKLALKEAKAHTEKHAGDDCGNCDSCKGARLGQQMMIL